MRFAIAFAACMVVAHAQDMGVLRKLSENKLGPIPGMPACVVSAVENGDPSKGPSTIVFKASAGCKIPWHWHTPMEQVMIVSGSAKVEMKGGSTAVLGPGGYARMPSKHVHQFTCTSACTAFVNSDGVFDIHYVDAAGKEIPPDKALATGK
ncbi:MAG TPA: cupin domain-containing protein [Bryobacteraceae bacterium]|nr:cupin domain-containing protein [Bryobacteraceae bacterium]